MKNVCVLMSTYNGEEFIRCQIESILSQVGVNVKLVIRDDGSTDNTVKIIEEFMEKNDNIELISGLNIGCLDSFMQLIYDAPQSEYYAFSDQDDYWDRDKLISAVNLISTKEADGKAVLYFSNLRLVDEKLNIIGASGNEATFSQKYKFVFGNYYTGCSLVFNSSLLKIIRMSRHEEMVGFHDLWIGMIATFLGEIVYDPIPHISYRQHSNNVIGMRIHNKNNKLRTYFGFTKSLLQKNTHFYQNIIKYFYKEYADYIEQNLSTNEKKIIYSICNYDKNFFIRIGLAFNKEFIDDDTLKQRIRHFLFVIFCKI